MPSNAFSPTGIKGRRTLVRPSHSTFSRTVVEKRDRTQEKYLQHQTSLDAVWNQWTGLGREPESAEVDDIMPLMQAFGSFRKTLRFIASRNDMQLVEASCKRRTSDLQVYFALNQFEKRKPYKHLDVGLQRDIKAFFGDYGAAQTTAKTLLFLIADTDAIRSACKEASEHGLGWLIEGESLHFTRL